MGESARNILITGATGNVGVETLSGFNEIGINHNVFAGVRNIKRAQASLKKHAWLHFREMDLESPACFDDALMNIDIVFLLRPPQLADVPKYFKPFTDAMKRAGVSKVVFLSVQGAEEQSFIPHHKLEKLIVDEGFEFVFLRPAYFMQNLTTTLAHEIKNRQCIFVPSGNLKFNWIDAEDIGLAAANVLSDFDAHANNAYELTGSEFTGFTEVAVKLSAHLGRTISYVSPNLIQFFIAKRKLNIPVRMIFIMIMLHFLPRFGENAPRLTDCVKTLTGKEPNTLAEFIKREGQLLG